MRILFQVSGVKILGTTFLTLLQRSWATIMSISNKDCEGDSRKVGVLSIRKIQLFMSLLQNFFHCEVAFR
jgi:hypothetical protein